VYLINAESVGAKTEAKHPASASFGNPDNPDAASLCRNIARASRFERYRGGKDGSDRASALQGWRSFTLKSFVLRFNSGHKASNMTPIVSAHWRKICQKDKNEPAPEVKTLRIILGQTAQREFQIKVGTLVNQTGLIRVVA
jgi:hypothetical protein